MPPYQKTYCARAHNPRRALPFRSLKVCRICFPVQQTMLRFPPEALISAGKVSCCPPSSRAVRQDGGNASSTLARTFTRMMATRVKAQ